MTCQCTGKPVNLEPSPPDCTSQKGFWAALFFLLGSALLFLKDDGLEKVCAVIDLVRPQRAANRSEERQEPMDTAGAIETSIREVRADIPADFWTELSSSVEDAGAPTICARLAQIEQNLTANPTAARQEAAQLAAVFRRQTWKYNGQVRHIDEIQRYLAPR